MRRLSILIGSRRPVRFQSVDDAYPRAAWYAGESDFKFRTSLLHGRDHEHSRSEAADLAEPLQNCVVSLHHTQHPGDSSRDQPLRIAQRHLRLAHWVKSRIPQCGRHPRRGGVGSYDINPAFCQALRQLSESGVPESGIPRIDEAIHDPAAFDSLLDALIQNREPPKPRRIIPQPPSRHGAAGVLKEVVESSRISFREQHRSGCIADDLLNLTAES